MGDIVDQSNIGGEWEDKSIATNDILAVQDPKFIKATPQYNVSNPHPKFLKDPNIINEAGHTQYPKMIYPKGRDHAGIIVKSPAEEAEHMGEKPADGLSDDGPTIEQFVAAGYKASDYPPEGFKSKSTDEEIKAAIAKETAKAGWGS